MLVLDVLHDVNLFANCIKLCPNCHALTTWLPQILLLFTKLQFIEPFYSVMLALIRLLKLFVIVLWVLELFCYIG